MPFTYALLSSGQNTATTRSLEPNSMPFV